VSTRDSEAEGPEAASLETSLGNPILDEQYRKLTRRIGLECARFDLAKHPDPFTVEVDVEGIDPDPYEVVKWNWGIGATHHAQATGLWHFPGDGRMLMLFEVRPVTPYPEERGAQPCPTATT